MLAHVDVVGARRRHGDRPDGVAAQVCHAGRVETGRVEGDDGHVGLTAGDGRQQVVDIDAALQHDDARVRLEVGQGR